MIFIAELNIFQLINIYIDLQVFSMTIITSQGKQRQANYPQVGGIHNYIIIKLPTEYI